MCVAAAIAGAAVVGAGASIYSSDQAASAQKDAANQASNTQRSMFNTIQGNEAPWVQTGQQAQNALAQFYGLPGGSAGGSAGGSQQPLSFEQWSAQNPSSGGGQIPYNNFLQNSGHGVGQIPGIPASGAGSADQSAAYQAYLKNFNASPASGASGTASTPDYNKILSNLPGYQFQLQQGDQAVQRNLAARGLLQSGAAAKSLETFGQGLASQYAGQYTQGLQNLSQLGEAGAAGVASAGMNAANQIGSNQIYGGNAAAVGAAGVGNAINSGLGGLAGAAGYYQLSPYYTSTNAEMDALNQNGFGDNWRTPRIFPSTGLN